MELGENNLSYKIKWLWKIVRHGSFLLGVRNRIAHVGIDFMPYYWLKEETKPILPPKIKDNGEDYSISYFGEDEIEIIQKRIKGIGHKNLLRNLEDGQMCVGIKKDKDIAAYMFIQTGNINFRGKTFQLRPNEAYLKDMYTFESYRGKNIAPYLRYNAYSLLREKGIDTKYSISEAFNRPTIRFKKKLNSEHLELYLSIKLFKRYQWTIKLRGLTDSNK
ncbi:GNAT family N-acetyltransferase [Flagellimonas sp.]|uniref:GNAT family N-acetyltransferase n=1 Tax=Flagellimonas sp. TaxID=2058762 RepID=UPI003B50E194